MRLNINHNSVEMGNILLKKRNLSNIGNISGITEFTLTKNLNSADEISFNVYKYIKAGDSEIINPLWDELISLRIVYIEDLDENFEIKVDDTEQESTIRNIVGTSLCEAELSQKNLYDIEINTETDIARDDYDANFPTQFYRDLSSYEEVTEEYTKRKNSSLLHRILDKTPNYSIGHVDSSLMELVTVWTIDDKTIYDFLVSDLATEIGCLFLFDTKTRTINVYDLNNRCTDCGKRIDTEEVCPYCGGTNISYGYGENTEVFINNENLANNITLTRDKDSLKNCFKIVGGDDDINAAVVNCNPNGTAYIYNFSQFQLDDMSIDLVEKINEYDILYNSKKDNFNSLVTDLYEHMDDMAYYQSTMMPTEEISDTSATLEVAKLTSEKIGTIGVSDVSIVSATTSTNAVLSYVKVLVDYRYKVEVVGGTGSIQNQIWTGQFLVTCRTNDEDYAYGQTIRIALNDDQESFLKQKIEKALNGYELTDTKEYVWSDYCLDSLNIFYNAYTEVLAVLIEHGDSESDSTFYESIYLPYKNKLEAIESEIAIREEQIAGISSEIEELNKSIASIHSELNFKDYIGDNLWLEFCAFQREDKYENTNYISTGLESADLIKKANELIEVANKELLKASTIQHSISLDMENILAMEEFEPLWDKFEVGNWIRVRINNEIFKLRLISYGVNYDDISSLSVEFSDVIVNISSASDTKSVLEQARSLASSYSYIETQSNFSYKNSLYVKDWLNRGLDATNVKIMNNSNKQSITIDEHGMLCKEWDDELDTYKDTQIRIIGATIAVTDDNWRSTKTAFGKFWYVNPDTGKAVCTYGINGQTIVGNLILGKQLKISNSSSTLSLDENGFSISNSINSFIVNPGDVNHFIKLTKNDETQIYVDSSGNVVLEKGVIIDANSVYAGKDATTTLTDYIKAQKISVDELDVMVGNIITANIDNATIKALNAKYIENELLYSKVANIDVANIGGLFAQSIQALTTTTVESTVDTGFIKSLIAGNIYSLANSTGFLTIGDDDDGNIVANGSTMQFKDSDGNVYIQLGTDSDGGHSLIVNDCNGTTLLNGSGITKDAIMDGLIVDEMVKKKDATYSGISSDALNIDSVVTSINNGTSTIKSSQIYFDEDNQTLNTKLNSMTTTISQEINNKIDESLAYTITIESTKGNIFKGATSATLTAIVKKGNNEVDTSGTLYTYTWEKYNADGTKYGTWAKTGKTISITDTEITEKAVFNVSVTN